MPKLSHEIRLRNGVSSKPWNTKRADKEFSKWIRERDGKCVRCGKKTNLQASHFWSRSHSSVRYDPENVDTLCAGCHIFKWEIEKQGEYREYMIRKLGMSKYKNLEKRARATVNRIDAIKQFQAWIQNHARQS